MELGPLGLLGLLVLQPAELELGLKTEVALIRLQLTEEVLVLEARSYLRAAT